ncbi:transcriptional regulator [Clostridium tetani]|uniref:helix-turn-helix domain-containing protein n=1 Tax=Clostridium tetani TaxID=1513 RepID=UPI002952B221|nr:helix-turn-helix transcriptional regulator [Clostridium tetani]BDR64446.1 transcriptional regulator [Clostridium tetani]BDR72660.1 transcriptional regulator [Clostridium tetani]
MFNKNTILKILDVKGWSKYKLAKKAGIPQSSLHDILSGKIKNPTGERLKAIADALGVSVNEFFDGENIETPKEKTDKSIKEDLPVIPEEFTKSDEARAYVDKHQIFGANGFDSDKLSDDEILEFANELLKQMELISFKYKK